ncbi:hypothetical protein CsSME_00022167 [Camellia sinensis var. sinensis]
MACGGGGGGGGGGGSREEEQDGMSVHSPCKAPPSSASSLRKEQSQVELELKLLEALAIYPPSKLRGMHRHFVIYGLMEHLRRSFGRPFSPTDVLQLLDRFYDLEMLAKIRRRGCGNPESGGGFLPAAKLFCKGRILSDKNWVNCQKVVAGSGGCLEVARMLLEAMGWLEGRRISAEEGPGYK